MTLLGDVVARSEDAIDVTLLSAVRCVDSVDPHDGQNPSSWTLSGPGAPRIVQIEGTREAGRPDRALVMRAYVSPLLQAGGAYVLGVTAQLRLATGAAVVAETKALAGPQRLALAGELGELGADVPLPLKAAGDGGLQLVGRLDALKRRLETLASSRFGSFGHLPGFGSGLEPKRQQTPAKLAAEARLLAAQVRADPDVLAAAVSVGPRAGATGVLDVTIDVVPRFAASPFTVQARVTPYDAPP